MILELANLIFLSFRNFFNFLIIIYHLWIIKWYRMTQNVRLVTHTFGWNYFLFGDFIVSHMKICWRYVRALTISLYNFVLKIKCHKTHLSKCSRTADNVFPSYNFYTLHFSPWFNPLFSLASLMNILLYNTRILRKLNTSKADELRWKLPNDDGWGQ